MKTLNLKATETKATKSNLKKKIAEWQAGMAKAAAAGNRMMVDMAVARIEEFTRQLEAA
jgi:hypothetical protein